MKRKSPRHLRRIAPLVWLFLKGTRPDKLPGSLPRDREETADFSRIRCPLCRWQPNASSRWQCLDSPYPEFFFGGCGTVWNTFETRGGCPGCQHQWRWTSCLACEDWSLHEDWYAQEKN